MNDFLRRVQRGLLWALAVVAAVLAGASVCVHAAAETHTEDLLLQVLPEGLLGAVFVFNTTGAAAAAHRGALPHALAELVRAHGVADLALSLTHGRWRTDAWGYAPLATEAPPGALLALTLAPGPHTASPAARLAGARRAVAALLCTALDTVDLAPVGTTVGDTTEGNSNDEEDEDEENTKGKERFKGASKGEYKNKEEGKDNEEFDNKEEVFLPHRGALPLETVCTENLAPWLQLLPCRDAAGVGALLRARRGLYGVPYHSLALRVTQSPGGTVTVVQTLALVTPRPASASLRLTDVFGTTGADATTGGALHACPVADESHITVALPRGRRSATESAGAVVAANSVRPAEGREALPGGWGVRYALPRGNKEQGLVLEIDADALAEQEHTTRHPLVSAHQFVTGYGQVDGGLVLEARSRAAVPVRVRVTQALPCYLRPYLASRRATLDGAPVRVNTVVRHRRHAGALHERVDAVAVTVATLPPRAVLRLALHFDAALLPVPEQPPEAERGRDLPAAVVDVAVPISKLFITDDDGVEDDENKNMNMNKNINKDEDEIAAHAADLFGPFSGVRREVLEDGREALVHTQYTEGLLVATPWPDFSMPYNVVCLTVTVSGLFFGWVVVRLQRHYGDLYDRATGTFRPTPRPIARIAALVTWPFLRVASLLRRHRKCSDAKEEEKEQEEKEQQEQEVSE